MEREGREGEGERETGYKFLCVTLCIKLAITTPTNLCLYNNILILILEGEREGGREGGRAATTNFSLAINLCVTLCIKLAITTPTDLCLYNYNNSSCYS